MNLMLIGAQGSGKGTQSALLAQKFGLVPCASGELLLKAIEEGSPLGELAKPYYMQGALVPDDVIIGLILDRITSLSGSQGFILDGFPRNLTQAQALDARLDQIGQSIERVIYLEVPLPTLLERLSGRYICRAHGHPYNIKMNPPRKRPGFCDIDDSELIQRPDDTESAIERRLGIFFRDTLPQLESHYKPLGKWITVDGTQSIEDVNRDILAKLAGG